MNITLSTESPDRRSPSTCSPSASAASARRKTPLSSKLDRAMGGALLAGDQDSTTSRARPGRPCACSAAGELKAKRVLLVGLGEREGAARERLLGVKAARALGDKGSTLGGGCASSVDPAGAVRRWRTGITTGAYRYTRYLTGDRKPKHALRRALILRRRSRAEARAPRSPRVRRSAARSTSRATWSTVRPTTLSATAARRRRRRRGQARRHRLQGLRQEGASRSCGMPLLLAVNRGSTEEPRFFHMTYKPKAQGARRRSCSWARA